MVDPQPLVVGRAASLVLVGAMAWRSGHPADVPPPPAVTFVVGAEGAPRPVPLVYGWPAVVSPNGRQVVYAAATGAEGYQYFVRDIGHLDARPIPGTEGAIEPTFSPDGQWLAFQSESGKLEKVPLAGGPAVSLADYSSGDGFAWSPGGEIILGGGPGEPGFGLLRVSDTGGTPVPLTSPDTTHGGQPEHVWPVLMPDGKTIVFTIFGSLGPTNSRSELAVTSLDDGVVHPLGIHAARALGFTGGQLVYLGANGDVMATPFDLRHRRAVDSPLLLIDSIPMCASCNGDGAVTLSAGGALAYMRGAWRSRLVWLSPGGAVEDAMPDAKVEASAMLETPRLSPDGGRIAVAMGGVATGTKGGEDIWIYQTSNRTLSRLTHSGREWDPAWTRDGHYVDYVSWDANPTQAGVWRQASDFSGEARRILASDSLNIIASVPSPDGRRILVQASVRGAQGVSSNLFAPVEGGAVTDSPYVTGPFNASEARFSPDGRRVAYVSDESDRPEVYVLSFPEPGPRVQISQGGGVQPVWAPDGRGLYYVAGTTLMEARLTTGLELGVISRDSLFSGPYFGHGGGGTTYDVSRDGKRFLVVKPSDEKLQLVVTLHWTSELAARLGKN